MESLLIGRGKPISPTGSSMKSLPTWEDLHKCNEQIRTVVCGLTNVRLLSQNNEALMTLAAPQESTTHVCAF